MPTIQHLRDNSKSASTKRGIILEGNATRMQTGNLYRETGSGYFYLINVNFLSRLSDRNELVKLPTGNIFIVYQSKYKKRLLLRCIHHFYTDLINNMDHMRISGNEPSSVILSQTMQFKKLKCDEPKVP